MSNEDFQHHPVMEIIRSSPGPVPEHEIAEAMGYTAEQTSKSLESLRQAGAPITSKLVSGVHVWLLAAEARRQKGDPSVPSELAETEQYQREKEPDGPTDPNAETEVVDEAELAWRKRRFSIATVIFALTTLVLLMEAVHLRHDLGSVDRIRPGRLGDSKGVGEIMFDWMYVAGSIVATYYFARAASRYNAKLLRLQGNEVLLEPLKERFAQWRTGGYNVAQLGELLSNRQFKRTMLAVACISSVIIVVLSEFSGAPERREFDRRFPEVQYNAYRPEVNSWLDIPSQMCAFVVLLSLLGYFSSWFWKRIRGIHEMSQLKDVPEEM